MNIRLNSLAALIALAVTLPLPSRAADDTPVAKEEKKALRVLTPDRRVVVRDGERRPIEKETVAFLGVETSPVSAAMSAQLGLARGTGLVVNQIVPKSPAGEALKVHDILLKLDDQILIEVRQLSVLIRNHNEGDEVTLSYLRGGQKNTVKVKLGKQEVPKMMSMHDGAPMPLFAGAGGDRFEVFTPNADRAEVDRLLSLIQRAPNGEPVRIHVDRSPGPGFRAVTVHTGNSNVVFSDDEGSIELTMKEGGKSLVAKDAKGQQVFSGPVNTPEERKALPPEVRERLEKVESMHDMTFRTDGDFKGVDTQIMRPRGIALPLPERPRQVHPSLFF